MLRSGLALAAAVVRAMWSHISRSYLKIINDLNGTEDNGVCTMEQWDMQRLKLGGGPVDWEGARLIEYLLYLSINGLLKERDEFDIDTGVYTMTAWRTSHAGVWQTGGVLFELVMIGHEFVLKPSSETDTQKLPIRTGLSDYPGCLWDDLDKRQRWTYSYIANNYTNKEWSDKRLAEQLKCVYGTLDLDGEVWSRQQGGSGQMGWMFT